MLALVAAAALASSPTPGRAASACPAEDQPGFEAMPRQDRRDAVQACVAEAEAAPQQHRVRSVPIEVGVGAIVTQRDLPAIGPTLRAFVRTPLGLTFGARAYAGYLIFSLAYGAGGTVAFTFDTPWEMRVSTNFDWGRSETYGILGGGTSVAELRGTAGFELINPSGSVGFGVELGASKAIGGNTWTREWAPVASTTITWYFL